MKRKILWIVAAVAVVLVGAGAGVFWYFSTQPMYKPGMVRAGENLRAPLTPPQQSEAPDSWQVEEDIRLHYFTQGEGRDVLIVHGGPGYPYQAAWTGLEPLSDQYRFYYYDQRGCGESTRPFDRFPSGNSYENMQTLEGTLGIGAQLADIERIRQILGEDKLILIGHSWGGFLAALYAAEFPERVEGLVLVAPADVLVMPQPDGRGLYEAVRARLPEEQQADYEAFMEAYFDFGKLFEKSEAELAALNEDFARYYSLAMGEELPEISGGGGWMVWAMYLSMGQRHDYTEALSGVQAPVLVLHGSEDFTQPEAASRAYTEAFPNGELRLVEGATHWPFEEQPEVFAQAVGGFLER